MTFDSIALGQSLGMCVASPYLDPAVVQHALRLRKAQCVGEVDDVMHGKLPLRMAFPNASWVNGLV